MGTTLALAFRHSVQVLLACSDYGPPCGLVCVLSLAISVRRTIYVRLHFRTQPLLCVAAYAYKRDCTLALPRYMNVVKCMTRLEHCIQHGGPIREHLLGSRFR